MDANQTAVKPDIAKMLSIAYSCMYKCNSGVYDNQTRYVGSFVACGIVNDIRPFWNFKLVNMLIYKSKSLNLHLNLIAFSTNQAIKCLL